MKYMSFGLGERTIMKGMLKTRGGYFQNGLKLWVTLKFGLQRKPPKSFYPLSKYIFNKTAEKFCNLIGWL
jgi:hypothetical protein